MLESQHMLRRDGQVRAGQLRVRARHGRMTPGSCLAQGAITETRRWNWGTPARPAPARPPAPAPARHARPVNSGRPPAGCRACDSNPHRAPLCEPRPDTPNNVRDGRRVRRAGHCVQLGLRSGLPSRQRPGTLCEPCTTRTGDCPPSLNRTRRRIMIATGRAWTPTRCPSTLHRRPDASGAAMSCMRRTTCFASSIPPWSRARVLGLARWLALPATSCTSLYTHLSSICERPAAQESPCVRVCVD